MPLTATLPAGMITDLALFLNAEPAGGLLNVILNVSEAGPVLRTVARYADGTREPFTGTLRMLSAVMFRVTPGGVEPSVMSTAACAAKSGFDCDTAVMKIGTVPL